MNTQQITDQLNTVKDEAVNKINEVKNSEKFQQEKSRVQSALHDATVSALENSASAAEYIARKAREQAEKMKL